MSAPCHIDLRFSIACANEKQHLAISNMLKTLAHTLDMAIEGKHPGNDCRFAFTGDHPDSVTGTPSAAEIAKAFPEKKI